MTKTHLPLDPMTANEEMIDGEWIWSKDGDSQIANIWLKHSDYKGKYCAFTEQTPAAELDQGSEGSPADTTYKVNKCEWYIDEDSMQLALVMNNDVSSELID
jgi:hypothetical protein